jgi:hypothetical protein
VVPPSFDAPYNFQNFLVLIKNNKSFLKQTHPLAQTIELIVGNDAILGFGRQAG